MSADAISQEGQEVGSIDYETFETHARSFLTLSETLYDTWCLKYEQNQVFLVKIQELQELKLEYHIVYNVAFCVPVLYFRIFRRCNGEIVWDMNTISRDKMHDKGVSQMPHPYYQTPFFQLHPCQTSKWMGEKLINAAAADKGSNYIVAWLSFIAPHVGLVFSEKYCAR